MRQKLLVGNWKMNNVLLETEQFISQIPSLCDLAKKKDIAIGVAPSYLSLALVEKNKGDMLIYSQEVRAEEKGAYTGDISIPMVKDFHIDGSLVGHSERRQYHNETNLECNKKIKALIANDLSCIYCVGETLEEFEANKANQVILEQIKDGLMDLTSVDMQKVVIAYEPVWSIGTGKSASKEIAETMCKYIRDLISDMFGKDVSNNIKILYGGSVKPNNIHDYMLEEDIDGALVGGASLKADSFSQLIENI